MSKTYKATSKNSVRNAPKSNAKVVGTKYKDNEVSVYEEKEGWGKISKKEEKWVSIGKYKLVSSTTIVPKENKANPNEGGVVGNKYRTSNPSVYGKSASTYKDLMRKHVRAFGSPPRYTSTVDPYYGNASDTAYTGRTMMQTWFSDPTIFSICPGKVDYLPGFNTSKKEQFYNKVKSMASGDVSSLIKKDHKKDLNGQLYAFKSAYNKYMEVVNLLCRTVANHLGIGNVSNLIWGGNTPLNKFDYGYFTTPSKNVGKQSIFSEVGKALNSAINDDSYIHFFVSDGQVSVTENFNTSSGETYFEKQIGENGAFSEAANNIAFLFNGVLSEGAQDDLDKILKETRDQSEFLGGLGTMAVNYLRGGRIVFPKMITGMDFSKTINCEMTFRSLYGDKRSIFLRCFVPTLHLFPLGIPQQMTENMYTFPFLVRCVEPGNVTCDLGFMDSLEITRGGPDGTCWTVNGLPTEITARFSITPLYSNMMVTSARNPFLYMNNTSMIEYLANMCGVDIKANNFFAKVELAKSLIKNYVSDTPTHFTRGLVDNYLIRSARNMLRF